MLSSISVRWSGAGFLSTQLATSDFYAGVADANAQAPVVGRTQLGVDVTQPVVPRVAAAALELDLPGGQVQLVVHHQDLFRLDLEEARQRGHRLARQVHEGLRLQQPHALAVHAGAARQPVVAALGYQVHLQLARQRINPPEPGVVARGLVIWARDCPGPQTA